MKDLFQNYHKHKMLSQLGILSVSAILAVSINMFVLGGETGEHLKANVLELASSDSEVDLVIENNENILNFTNKQEIRQVVELSISLAYNPELLSLQKLESDLENASITTIENEDGFSTYIITLDSPVDIPLNTQVLSLDKNKSSAHTAHLNPININFTDSSGEIFLLSSKAIMF